MKYFLPFILLLSITASAQVVRYDNFAATTASASGIGNLLQAIPSATITVFNYPGSGVSCAGGGCVAATTYTNKSGATACGGGLPLTRPTSITCLSTADLQGNFGFWALAGAYQYCIAATNFTTQCTNAVVGFGGNVATIVNGPSDPNWSGSDDGARINSAISSAIAATPLGAQIWITSGTYSVATTIRVSKPNVQLKCIGGGPISFNGSTGACKLKWTGTNNGGPIVLFDTTNTSGINGDGLYGFNIDCNTVNPAATAVQIASVGNSVFSDLQIQGACSSNFFLSTIDTNTTAGNGENEYKNITINSNGTGTAQGWNITSPVANQDSFNSAYTNIAINLTGQSGGDAFHIENADNERMFEVTLQSGTGGFGLHYTCIAGATTNNECAREMIAWGVESGSTGIRQDGVSTFYATSNRVYGYEICNGSPVPSTSNILKGSVYVDILDCGDVNFGNLSFSANAGGASFLARNDNLASNFIVQNVASQYQIFEAGGGARITLTHNGNTAIAATSGGIINLNSPYGFTNALESNSAPTIAAGGCGGSGASIVTANGTAAFDINVGTAPTSAGCTVTMTSVTTGWNCSVNDFTTISTSVFVQKQTAKTTNSVTFVNYSDVAVATAPTANDIYHVTCTAN